MTRNFIVGLATALIAAISASAQFSPSNARIGSIGNIYIIDDISNVYRYAAHMSKYGDDIQVTFSAPILGIKSFSDVLSLGLYVSNRLVLDQESTSDFYESGRGFLNAGLNPDLATDPVFIPHVLVGLTVGVFTLGFDVFVERAHSRFTQDITVGNVTTTTKIRSTMQNSGFIGSILLDINALPVSLKAGLSLPSINGLNEVSGPVSSKIEYKSDKGFHMEIGGEIGIPLGDLRLTTGADYNLETYAFQLNSTDPTNEFTTNRLAIFGGLQKEAFDDGLWALLYEWKLKAYKNDANDSAVVDVSNRTVEQRVSAGAENGWDDVWIFDKVFVRGGVALSMNTPYTKRMSSIIDESQKDETTFFAEPTVGLGIAKEQFELDTRIILTPTGGWDKLVTGPGVATVTGTLRF